MGTDSERRDRLGWRDWDRRIWILLGLVVGAAAGWWAGSWSSACADGNACAPRWEAVSAIGTWAGGLGTIGAVLVAVQAFQTEERARRHEAQSTQEERTRFEEVVRVQAQLVSIEAMIGSYTGEAVTEVRVTARNKTNTTPVHKLVMDVGQFAVTHTAHELKAGNFTTFSVTMGSSTDREAVRVPMGERAGWLNTIVESTVLSFTLSDRRWQRVGIAPAVEVDESTAAPSE